MELNSSRPPLLHREGNTVTVLAFKPPFEPVPRREAPIEIIPFAIETGPWTALSGLGAVHTQDRHPPRAGSALGLV
jgi:hypothetical protein